MCLLQIPVWNKNSCLLICYTTDHLTRSGSIQKVVILRNFHLDTRSITTCWLVFGSSILSTFVHFSAAHLPSSRWYERNSARTKCSSPEETFSRFASLVLAERGGEETEQSIETAECRELQLNKYVQELIKLPEQVSTTLSPHSGRSQPHA